MIVLYDEILRRRDLAQSSVEATVEQAVVFQQSVQDKDEYD